MAEIIGARADAGRIEDHVRRTMRAARARGEHIAAAAEERLAPAIAAVDAAAELQKTANECESAAWAQASALVASAGFRVAIRSARARLQAFKTDLLTLGLTDAQVYEIIPDASVGVAGGGNGKATTGATPGNGIGAAPTG